MSYVALAILGTSLVVLTVTIIIWVTLSRFVASVIPPYVHAILAVIFIASLMTCTLMARWIARSRDDEESESESDSMYRRGPHAERIREDERL